MRSPDDQELYDEASAYNDLMDAATPLAIADAPEKGPGYLLSLDGEWFECQVKHSGGALWLIDPSRLIFKLSEGSRSDALRRPARMYGGPFLRLGRPLIDALGLQVGDGGRIFP
jgi:hypothetical protein